MVPEEGLHVCIVLWYYLFRRIFSAVVTPKKILDSECGDQIEGMACKTFDFLDRTAKHSLTVTVNAKYTDYGQCMLFKRGIL